MTASDNSTVTVFGASDPAPGSAAWDDARRAGRVLAECGFAIANGGYGGTMAASAMGAAEAGGTVTGVTCSIWTSRPNDYNDRIIATETHGERLSELVRLGTAGYLVLPGATGTLVELATVWEYALKGFLPARPDGGVRPIVCFGAFWRPLVAMMAAARRDAADAVRLIDTAEELREVF